MPVRTRVRAGFFVGFFGAGASSGRSPESGLCVPSAAATSVSVQWPVAGTPQSRSIIVAGIDWANSDPAPSRSPLVGTTTSSTSGASNAAEIRDSATSRRPRRRLSREQLRLTPRLDRGPPQPLLVHPPASIDPDQTSILRPSRSKALYDLHHDCHPHTVHGAGAGLGCQMERRAGRSRPMTDMGDANAGQPGSGGHLEAGGSRITPRVRKQSREPGPKALPAPATPRAG